MNNSQVAQLLHNMGTLLEIKGEIFFKIRAYFKAAENISSLSEDLQAMSDEGRLPEIPGVGKAIQEKITEYLVTGKMSAYEKLTQEIPETLLDIIRVPFVGTKKAKLFYEKCGVTDLAGLKRAAQNGELLKLEGIREKTVQNILDGVALIEQRALDHENC